jgi:hypothetical protein
MVGQLGGSFFTQTQAAAAGGSLAEWASYSAIVAEGSTLPVTWTQEGGSGFEFFDSANKEIIAFPPGTLTGMFYGFFSTGFVVPSGADLRCVLQWLSNGGAQDQGPAAAFALGLPVAPSEVNLAPVNEQFIDGDNIPAPFPWEAQSIYLNITTTVGVFLNLLSWTKP